MDDFSAKPGVPNFFGLIGAEANSIAPGKRMLSSMTPTILEKGRSVKGSNRQSWRSDHYHLGILQTIVNLVDYDMSMQAAVESKKVHHPVASRSISKIGRICHL